MVEREMQSDGITRKVFCRVCPARGPEAVEVRQGTMIERNGSWMNVYGSISACHALYPTALVSSQCMIGLTI